MRFDNVSFRYPGEQVDAVGGFFAQLEGGTVTALLGANGSGKSTVLGMGAGWLRPGRGTVEHQGGVAFLPQTERLAFGFSCLEYVLFGRAPHLPYLGLPGGSDVGKARDALDAVGMLARADRRITALSGGELQLVRLARALAQDASWVLLDEPTDMLDPAHIAAVGATVRKLAANGVGVLLSTHDIGFALTAADAAILMLEGRAIASGCAREVITCETLSGLYGTPFALAGIPSPAM